jgi:hypothetical protein
MTPFLLLCVLLGTILIIRKVYRMAFTLNDIENAITAQNTVIDSVGVLLNQLTDRLAAANVAGDSEEIGRIIGEIQSNTARLTGAVTANTPGGQAVVTPIAVASAPAPIVAPLPVVDAPAPVQDSAAAADPVEPVATDDTPATDTAE